MWVGCVRWVGTVIGFGYVMVFHTLQYIYIYSLFIQMVHTAYGLHVHGPNRPPLLQTGQPDKTYNYTSRASPHHTSSPVVVPDFSATAARIHAPTKRCESCRFLVRPTLSERSTSSLPLCATSSSGGGSSQQRVQLLLPVPDFFPIPMTPTNLREPSHPTAKRCFFPASPASRSRRAAQEEARTAGGRKARQAPRSRSGLQSRDLCTKKVLNHMHGGDT
jgi:hypothetical protein